MEEYDMKTGDAVWQAFTSSGPDTTNICDAVDELARCTSLVANAITPIGSNACPGHDETGGAVGSLTEAFMGVTAGLCKIANAITDLAEAVRETKR